MSNTDLYSSDWEDGYRSVCGLVIRAIKSGDTHLMKETMSHFSSLLEALETLRELSESKEEADRKAMKLALVSGYRENQDA